MVLQVSKRHYSVDKHHSSYKSSRAKPDEQHRWHNQITSSDIISANNTNAEPSHLDLNAKIKHHLDKVLSASATSIPLHFQESDDADGNAGFEGEGSLSSPIGMLDVSQVRSRYCLGFSDARVDNRMPKRMPGAGVDWKIA